MSHLQVHCEDHDMLDFLVHNFEYLGATPTSALLNASHRLIHAATSPRGWISVGWRSHGWNPSSSCRRSVEYTGPRPHIPFKATGYPRPLKEWGEPIGADDDVYDLDDLEEFGSTDLSSLWPASSSSKEYKRSSSIEEPPLKRRKLDVYPLHDLIPQPHVHPSQGNSSTTLDVPRFIAKNPTAIPPYTLPFSASPFSRSAWLIPIRGSLPWEGSTPAVVLDTSFSMPASPNPNTGDPITWTHASLTSFWSFLLHVQWTRRLGALGISFQPSNPVSPFTSSNPESNWSSLSLISGIGNQAGLESHMASEERSMVTASPAPPATLSNVDHIKVYHEAPNAMHVRAVLFSWAYPPLFLSEKHETDRSPSVRVLEGARLVLVDERSQGILIA